MENEIENEWDFYNFWNSISKAAFIDPQIFVERITTLSYKMETKEEKMDYLFNDLNRIEILIETEDTSEEIKRKLFVIIDNYRQKKSNDMKFNQKLLELVIMNGDNGNISDVSKVLLEKK